ncbi:hypothetical protein [Lysinibacillus xylanilyticus]|uniref:hypothetical protein n=1 Tax=Lysinibacillus xylanilyticus TaxID=582475 RepID=UPI0037F6DEAF
MSKKFEYIFIASVVIFVVSFLIFTGHFLFRDSEYVATITGGFLSFFGGSVGAFGAYLVARFQMKKEKENEKLNKLAKELPVYAALEYEFERVVEFLEGENQLTEILEYPKNKRGFYQVSMDIWDKKWEVSDTIILRDIIFFQNKLKRIRKSYETDIDSLEKECTASFGKKNYPVIHREVKKVNIERKNIWEMIPGDYDKAKEILSSIKTQRIKIQKIINKEITHPDDKIYLRDI